MAGVDQRRVLGSGRLDIGAARLRTKRLQADGDDLNPLVVNLVS
ncbi:MAG: hypothetical protein OER95_03980 [Acidimicrobiia bacterium]|nr:hypothetical protein [Acidimicrobiia bacterium]